MKWFLAPVGVLVAILLLYALAMIALAYWPVNPDFRQTSGGIRIYLRTSGVHADIVVPTVTVQADWRQTFPLSDYPVLETYLPYVSFGWGDRGFYMNTPQWSDLTLKTALEALSGLGSTAMHIQYLHEPLPGERVVTLGISFDQYRRLTEFFRRSLWRDSRGDIARIGDFSYFGVDALYEARGTYHLFYTCNDWVREAFSKAGIRTARWSPLVFPLFMQLSGYRSTSPEVAIGPWD